MTPFRIEIAQADIDDLHHRLDQTRWPDELPGVGWDYGVGRDYLTDLAHRWRYEFDWRAHEARLNQWPQFHTEIDAEQLHFAHLRSSRPDATPLLLVHGWPSTFADFLPIADQLAEPDDDSPAFHVVIPSVPGFGFSGPTGRVGWDVTRIATAFAELMHRLGYSGYVAQGGDYGSLIAPEVGRVDPDHVTAVHVNALVTLGAIDWSAKDPLAGLSDAEKAIAYSAGASWRQRSGYAAIQSTRPQTLAYGLTDSPTGLLAWNLEWFVDYDPGRTEQVAIDPDAILRDVSICWFTRTAGSSARLYKESATAFSRQPNSGIPTAVAVFPGDAAIRTPAERSNHVVRWTAYDRGGHFASLQAPDLLVTDIRAFVAAL